MREHAILARYAKQAADLPILLHRIENRVHKGTPDYLWTSQGFTAFLEMKSYDTGHWVSPEQAIFMRKWTEAGGHAGVLASGRSLEWDYYPALADHSWVKKIQDRKIAPAFSFPVFNYSALLQIIALHRELVPTISGSP
jgi:hypothetical protein